MHEEKKDSTELFNISRCILESGNMQARNTFENKAKGESSNLAHFQLPECRLI